MDRVALPFCQITLKAQKPSKIPQNPTTIGEHIRKRRLELELFQSDVAKIIGVTECTIYNWENNYSSPTVKFIPPILKFLGYNPTNFSSRCFAEQIIYFRKTLGLSQKELAQKLGIDPSTVRRLESTNTKITKNSKAMNKIKKYIQQFSP